MVNVLGVVAVGCCGLFAEAALREWAPGYTRAAVMQASLAVLGGVAGVVTWALRGGLGYLVGALLLLAVVPFTLLVVFPTNKRLLDLHAKGEVGNAQELLQRWNRLHAVRSVLSVAAFAFMLSGLR